MRNRFSGGHLCSKLAIVEQMEYHTGLHKKHCLTKISLAAPSQGLKVYKLRLCDA